MDSLRAVGATVDPAGTRSADFLAPEKQLLTVNGEDIQAFAFGSAEEADAAAGGVSATGSSIVTTMADGTQMASMITWVESPHFYKAGKLIVIYVGSDSDVIDALQDAMGPQFAGGESLPPAPGIQPAPAISSPPPVRLTFDGVEYAGVERLGAASPNGPIVCCGTPINMDDMEVVGTGTRNNPDGDGHWTIEVRDPDGTLVTDEVYRPKAGATTDVYTFHPATTVEVREPGGLPPSPAQPATWWTRWTTDVAPPAPLNNERSSLSLTDGSPPPPAPSGSPLAALKFRDVNYVYSGSAELLSGEGAVGEGAVFVVDGTEINVDDLELVGSTDESNTGYPGATGAGLLIYRLKDGETNHVYEFRPGKDHVNPEDGQIFKGYDSWTRWTAQ